MPDRNTLGRRSKDATKLAPSGIGSAGMALAVRLGMAGFFASCLLLAMAESSRAQESSETEAVSLHPDAPENSPHDYTVALRGGVWVTWVNGEVKDTSGRAPSGANSIRACLHSPGP